MEYGQTQDALFQFTSFWADHLLINPRLGLTEGVEETLLGKIDGQKPGVREILRSELRGIRDRLGYASAPPLERLIIAEIVIAWLWLQWLHCQCAAAETIRLGEYWDKKLTGAQKRFLRSCESLERVRRLQERPMSPAALAYLKGTAAR